ncbi:unnamed protein product [Orchesella dallaii]|uniref:Uncharacterized protein n=1 Tax=Orchesella dallaii TaxID=48710 RepID=A0ABP1RXM4_9HEXA
MQESEKKIIKRNLQGLIENTECTITVFSILLALDILSDEDVESIEAYPVGSKAQTFKFYTIIQKRENGFNALLKVLKDTKQSKALKFLQNSSNGCIKSPKSKRKTKKNHVKIECNFEEVLGYGTYGTPVYKGKLGVQEVAVKAIQPGINIYKLDQELKRIMECGNHENIITYHCSQRQMDTVLIALEHCHMNLSEWIADKSIDILPIEVLRQLTVGMDWLHKKKIVHRDLKPESVLLNKNTKLIKISGFGHSRALENGENRLSTLDTNGGWAAPEILRQELSNGTGKPKFTFASDQFALGCLYYYVLSDGKHPFGDATRRQVNIMDGKPRIEKGVLKHGCPNNMTLIKLMISKNPILRPSCKYLLTCPIFWTNHHIHEHNKNDIGIIQTHPLNIKCSECNSYPGTDVAGLGSNGFSDSMYIPPKTYFKDQYRARKLSTYYSQGLKTSLKLPTKGIITTNSHLLPNLKTKSEIDMNCSDMSKANSKSGDSRRLLEVLVLPENNVESNNKFSIESRGKRLQNQPTCTLGSNVKAECLVGMIQSRSEPKRLNWFGFPRSTSFEKFPLSVRPLHSQSQQFHPDITGSQHYKWPCLSTQFKSLTTSSLVNSNINSKLNPMQDPALTPNINSILNHILTPQGIPTVSSIVSSSLDPMVSRAVSVRACSSINRIVNPIVSPLETPKLSSNVSPNTSPVASSFRSRMVNKLLYPIRKILRPG